MARAILAMTGWADRADTWKQLTEGGDLYRQLARVVASDRPGDWDWAAEWDSLGQWDANFLQAASAAVKREGEVVRQLLWCAEQAAASIDSPSSPPSFVHNSGIALGWIRTFRRHPARCCRVPVALYDRTEQAGSLATLVLEVLEDGTGICCEHPIDAFRYRDDTFARSFGFAWRRGRELAGDSASLDARFRLLQDIDGRDRSPDRESVPSVAGASASAAAAWGWCYAIRRQWYDEDAIIFGQVLADGRFGGVDGVAQKTREVIAAVRQNRASFDRIFVADAHNLTEASAVLLDHGTELDLEVVDLSSALDGWGES